MTEKDNSEVYERYFRELSIALRREGFSVNAPTEDSLTIRKDGALAGTARFHAITYPTEGMLSAPRETQEKAWSVIRSVSEYMRQMESASLLRADGLKGEYRILGQFNDTVLAGHNTPYGVQFITWDWNADHTALSQGWYVIGEYEAAKRDFAVRSGLVQKEYFFTPDQLRGMDACCASALACDGLTFEQEQMISELRSQLRELEPSLEEQDEADGQSSPHKQQMTM